MGGLLLQLSFTQRSCGSHHLFTKPGIVEKINLQRDDGKAKLYQVCQVRNVIIQYQLGELYEIIIYWSNEDQAFIAEQQLKLTVIALD